jgi:hypothetical protein
MRAAQTALQLAPVRGWRAYMSAVLPLTFASTVTIISFMPDAWAAPTGDFSAMTIDTAFLAKDIVILTASSYLFRQDVIHAILCAVPLRQKTPSGERLACNQSAAILEL